jgi:NTE family protein
MAAKVANTRQAICDLLQKLPSRLKDDEDVLLLAESIRNAPTDIVQMIYRKASYELESKDYEFSRASVLEHWHAGERDTSDAITHPEWLKFTGLNDGVTQYCARRREVREKWAV